MSRYDWPPAPWRGRSGARRGRAAERRQYNLDRNAGFDFTTLMANPVQRTAGTGPSPGTVPLGAASAPGGFAPAPPPAGSDPNPDRNLWLPAGPSDVLRGLADGDPRVSGRVKDIAVSPNGQRAYAASALGGLWYSEDAGGRWEPVGQWAMVASAANVPAVSNTLTCGAVHVRFDPAGNDPANDEVWVGTGEPGQTLVSPSDFGNHGQYTGVGVLHATGPVRVSRVRPRDDPWTLEAQPRPAAGGNPAYPGLRGDAVFSFAVDPADDTLLVAATTNGLHHNGGPLPDRWLQVALPIGAGLVVTDVVWTPSTGAHPPLLWVAVVDTTAASPAGTAVWVSAAGTAGPFVQINLPAVQAQGRLALAADTTSPDRIHVLGTGPRLWRLDAANPFPAAPAAATPPAVATRIARVPSRLFGGGVDSSQYNMAIAIDPRNANRVIVGGSFASRPTDPNNGAALYRLTVSGTPPHTDYAVADTNASDARWIGLDVHSDVHRVRWLAVDGADHVWVCCDGGVFRSIAAGDRGSFVGRASGLAVLEPGYLASHPVSDGLVLAGVQDNGTLMRIGESVWRTSVSRGDGGGVAFDPGTTGRFAAQRTDSEWLDDGGPPGGISPARRITSIGQPGEPAVFTAEDNASAFYSNPTVLLRGDGTTQLAISTHRIWYSERWGRSRLVAGIWRRDWTTLPTNLDPRTGNSTSNANARQDVLPLGPAPPGPGVSAFAGVRVVRWSGPDRVYAMTRGAIYQFDRNPPVNGVWAPQLPAPPVGAAPPPPGVHIAIRAAVAAPLAWPVAGAAPPDQGAYNDLAVHNHPAAGLRSSLYLATSHPLEPLWWFDGQNPGQWHPARLGTDVPPAIPAPPPPVPVPATGVRAPAYAVAVDPDDSNIVYVGTAIGVWRGVLNIVGGNPTWAWAPFNSALPEALVQDLAITTWPRPAGGPLKLLRAALQSRGVFEVEPGADVTPTTYLRVHPFDTRRIVPTDLRDPMFNLAAPERDWTLDWAERRNRDYRTGAGQPAPTPDGTPVGSFTWHASPDIRLYPAPGGGAVPLPPGAPALPWTNAAAKRPRDLFWFWSLQTALRGLAPAVAPGAHLIVPDGRWTNPWRRQLEAVRTALGIPGTTVSAALWNHAQVQAAFWSDPWTGGGPTETDLTERIYGMATPRVGAVTTAATSPASLAVMRRPYRLLVCLHHRGRAPLPAGFPAVVLFRLPLPANPATWAGLPTVTTSAATLGALWLELDLMGASGPLPPQFSVPLDWITPDAGAAVRRPPDPADPNVPVAATGSPAIATFNVDFTADDVGSRFMFVALVHSTTDSITLTGATLRDMILNSHFAAARSVEVI